MEVAINYTREPSDPTGRPVKIGWMLADDRTAVIYDPPERLTMRGTQRAHAKSASRCPAVVNMESRYFVVKCPVDIHVSFERDENGKAVLRNRSGNASSIRASKLGKMLSLTSETEWRYPDRPTVQLAVPYMFICDETVYMTQVGTFAHYSETPLPGTIFGGRFPIDVWPRALMWAFEWHDTNKDLILKRGQPLFYCQFETDYPDRAIQMIRAKRTPELTRYIEQITAAVNYVNQTFSLFEAAREMRPSRLLVEDRIE